MRNGFYDKLADAKRYLDKVLDEVTKMKSEAMIQQNISSLFGTVKVDYIH
jgi:hypothetical protein